MASRRLYFIEKFSSIFKMAETDIIPLNLEKGMFNSTVEQCKTLKIPLRWANKQFIKNYVKCGHKVIANLTYTPNAEKIKSDILKGVLKPENIAYMTHKELYPEMWAELESIKKAKYITKKEKLEDGLFKCTKCKTYKTIYTQAQTRSADEPMTTFVTCLNCGTRWKC